MIRGQANELYEQLLKASTIIIEMTGVLLPMYDKALFSDATYAAIRESVGEHHCHEIHTADPTRDLALYISLRQHQMD